MEWTLFVQMVLANPLLLLSWEFLSSAAVALLVFKLTGHKVELGEIRKRIGHAILGAETSRSLRERIAERIAGRPIVKAVDFEEAPANGKAKAKA